MNKILILGDVIQDFNLMEYPPVPSHTYQALPKTIQVKAPGGVRYLRDLINKIMPDKSVDIQCPGDAWETNAIKVFNTWKQFPKVPNDKGKKVWRIARIIGRTDLDRDRCKECVIKDLSNSAVTDIDMLIIDDLGLGWMEALLSLESSDSKENSAKKEPEEVKEPPLKKLLLENTNPDQIILKLSSLDKGLPFSKDSKLLAKMTVILSAHTLRERGAAISEGLSWDQTIEDTVREFESGLSQFDLALCKRVIVLFSAEGAAVFERGGDPVKFRLQKFLYHPSQYEGSFKANHPGQMSGNLSLVTAAVVRHLVLLERQEKYPLFVALSLALTAIRKQYEDGFQEDEEAKDPNIRFNPEKQLDSPCAILTLPDGLTPKVELSDGENDPSQLGDATESVREEAWEKIFKHKAELDKQIRELLKKVTQKTRFKLAGEAAPIQTNRKIDLAQVQAAIDTLNSILPRESTGENILNNLAEVHNLPDLAAYLVLLDEEGKSNYKKKDLNKYLDTFSCAFRYDLLEYPPPKSPSADTDPTKQGSWESNLLRDVTGYSHEYVAAKAFQIVMRGAKNALSNVPIASYGNFLTADREEIERVNAIRKLIISYLDNPQDKKPLSLAVFGPPGSGKSFSIKQLAAELGFTEKSIHTFNLSEFKDPLELHVAFHIVRDATIQGKIPLIFWDEFDSDTLSWLKEFLAPMQDAEFRAGSVVHPIGKAIFVFAGGVFSSFEEFEEKTGSKEEKKNDQAHGQGSALKPGENTEKQAVPASNPYEGKKAPDFISRLRGYVNIKGPNPQEMGDKNDEYLIRRAILLRSVLERNFGHLLGAKGQAAISAPIVQAFLRVDKYKHGARSLESIVTMSELVKAPYFGEAALPPDHLLNLHVDASRFRVIMRDAALNAPIMELISEACHNAWMEGKISDGYTYGPVRSDIPPKRHPLLEEYHKLDENGKEGNRLTARVTQAKLKQVGLEIIAPIGGSKTFSIGPFDVNKDHLMRVEHDIWMRDHLLQGYEFSEETVDALKLHRCVARFDKLTKEDIKLDEAIVNSLGEVLVKEGYGVKEKS